MRRAFTAAAAVMVFAVAVACDPGPTPSSSPSSAPTAITSATPTTASPTPAPTSTEAALYSEAEAVFLAYQKAAFEIAAQGGAEALPASVAPYVMGDYIVTLESHYRDLKNQGRQVRNGDAAKVAWTRPAPNDFGSLAAVDACVDSSRVEWRNRDTEWTKGGVGEVVYYFKRDTDGRLKIFDLAPGKTGGCP